MLRNHGGKRKWDEVDSVTVTPDMTLIEDIPEDDTSRLSPFSSSQPRPKSAKRLIIQDENEDGHDEGPRRQPNIGPEMTEGDAEAEPDTSAKDEEDVCLICFTDIKEVEEAAQSTRRDGQGTRRDDDREVDPRSAIWVCQYDNCARLFCLVCAVEWANRCLSLAKTPTCPQCTRPTDLKTLKAQAITYDKENTSPLRRRRILSGVPDTLGDILDKVEDCYHRFKDEGFYNTLKNLPIILPAWRAYFNIHGHPSIPSRDSNGNIVEYKTMLSIALACFEKDRKERGEVEVPTTRVERGTHQPGRNLAHAWREDWVVRPQVDQAIVQGPGSGSGGQVVAYPNNSTSQTRPHGQIESDPTLIRTIRSLTPQYVAAINQYARSLGRTQTLSPYNPPTRSTSSRTGEDGMEITPIRPLPDLINPHHPETSHLILQQVVLKRNQILARLDPDIKLHDPLAAEDTKNHHLIRDLYEAFTRTACSSETVKRIVTDLQGSMERLSRLVDQACLESQLDRSSRRGRMGTNGEDLNHHPTQSEILAGNVAQGETIGSRRTRHHQIGDFDLFALGLEGVPRSGSWATGSRSTGTIASVSRAE